MIEVIVLCFHTSKLTKPHAFHTCHLLYLNYTSGRLKNKSLIINIIAKLYQVFTTCSGFFPSSLYLLTFKRPKNCKVDAIIIIICTLQMRKLDQRSCPLYSPETAQFLYLPETETGHPRWLRQT